MDRHVLVILCLAIALFVGSTSGAAGAAASGVSIVGPNAVRGLLVLESGGSTTHVSIVTLEGRQLSVPPNVQISPLGLSPDNRVVARLRVPGGVGPPYGDAVQLGAVRGLFKTVLAGDCWNICLQGPDPSFAWNPDGSRLAAAVEREKGPTVLRLYDRSGHLVRSITLPRRDRSGERLFHHLLSWSPDGSRLLLMQGAKADWHALIVLDLASTQVRTLVGWGHNDQPGSFAWSPDGRYVALAGGEGFSGDDYTFAVIDVVTAKPLLYCTGGSHCTTRFANGWSAPAAFAWAPDSRGLFARSGSSGLIERLQLTGARSAMMKGGAGRILAAFDHRLVYDSAVVGKDGYTVKRDTLYLLDLATGRGRPILRSRLGISEVRPLAKVP